MRLIAIVVTAGVASAWMTGAAAEPKTLDDVVAEARAGIEYVDEDYLAARRAANPDLLLIDVRSRQEFEDGHIPGAQWVDRGGAEFELARRVRDAETEMILYCRTGARSALVAKALDRQGYTNVRVYDGFEAWQEAGGAIAEGPPETP